MRLSSWPCVSGTKSSLTCICFTGARVLVRPRSHWRREHKIQWIIQSTNSVPISFCWFPSWRWVGGSARHYPFCHLLPNCLLLHLLGLPCFFNFTSALCPFYSAAWCSSKKTLRWRNSSTWCATTMKTMLIRVAWNNAWSDLVLGAALFMP